METIDESRDIITFPKEISCTFPLQMPRISEDEIFTRICETKEFQRLKTIHQLGIMLKVHSTFKHTRYDHCIGVYRRAGWFLEILERNSNIKIDEFHKMCVKFAGLLHDIGHGPYSHFWETVMYHCDKLEYTHEEVGAIAVEKVFKKVKLSNDWIEHDYGVELIKRLIVGDKENFQWKSGVKEEFIFDIINNKSSAIDVDRLDYLFRDWDACKCIVSIPHMNVNKHLENVTLLFSGARISPNRKSIQFNKNHIKCINSMFSLREAFHKNIYQLFEVRILEDIFLKVLNLRKDEEDSLPSFLVFNDANEYVERNLSQNPINDETVEKWLRQSSNTNVQKLLKAFYDFNKYVKTSNEFKDGFECVRIEYKYKLPLSIENCFYGDDPIIGLKREYHFEQKIFYAVEFE